MKNAPFPRRPAPRAMQKAAPQKKGRNKNSPERSFIACPSKIGKRPAKARTAGLPPADIMTSTGNHEHNISLPPLL